MEFKGGCHCGNLQVRLSLTQPPETCYLRSCACSFCRAHGTRTVSDPQGRFEVRAQDWNRVSKYRFATRTADYVLCCTCGVYIGAVCETARGLRAVVNTNCLDARDEFSQAAARPVHDAESVEDRLARRAANWTPAILVNDR
jgi:hypothetical protein